MGRVLAMIGDASSALRGVAYQEIAEARQLDSVCGEHETVSSAWMKFHATWYILLADVLDGLCRLTPKG